MLLRHEEWFQHAFKSCGDLPEGDVVPMALDAAVDISSDDSGSGIWSEEDAPHSQPPPSPPSPLEVCFHPPPSLEAPKSPPPLEAPPLPPPMASAPPSPPPPSPPPLEASGGEAPEGPGGESPEGPGGQSPGGADPAADARLEAHDALVQLGDAYQPSASSASSDIRGRMVGSKNGSTLVQDRWNLGLRYNTWKVGHQGHRANIPPPHRVRYALNLKCVKYELVK